MIAAALPSNPAAPAAPQPQGSVPGQLIPGNLQWRYVGRFATLERAMVTVKRLQDQGYDSRLSMLDGLSVLACIPEYAHDSTESDAPHASLSVEHLLSEK